jgi:hypothetical protein
MLLTMTDGARRQRWEGRADWPLTITAVVFLAAYAAPILRPDLSAPLPTICRLLTWGAWALFVVDYAARLVLSRDRAAFVRGNVIDLAVVVLPLLRPLRLLRLVTLFSVLNRYAGGSMRGRVAVYVAGALPCPLRRVAGRPRRGARDEGRDDKQAHEATGCGVLRLGFHRFEGLRSRTSEFLDTGCCALELIARNVDRSNRANLRFNCTQVHDVEPRPSHQPALGFRHRAARSKSRS